jgi:hypothetical protein
MMTLTRAPQRSSRSYDLAWLPRIVALTVAAFALLAAPSGTHARLDPYYILRGESFSGSIKPRLVVVLDSSEEMARVLTTATQACDDECEKAGGQKESRVSVLRRVLKKVIAENADQVDFSLLSFRHAQPPTSSAQVPARCTSNKQPAGSNWAAFTPSSSRFMWVDEIRYPGSNNTEEITNPFTVDNANYTGGWMLCGDNRPYPYLRHDNLGFTSPLPQKDTAALPPAPLYRAKSTWNRYGDRNANVDRKVQWFPRYLGERVHLDCSAQADMDVVAETFGDYYLPDQAPSAGNAATNVCGRDFYYWPYVDGFMGYSLAANPSATANGRGNLNGNGVNPYDKYLAVSAKQRASKQECRMHPTSPQCFTVDDARIQPGLVRPDRPTSGGLAGLVAPFYMDSALSLPPEEQGPLTPEEANAVVMGLLSPATAGGFDVGGTAPMRRAIGDVDTYVSGAYPNLSKGPGFDETNAPYSHDTVASYLAFVTMSSPADLCAPLSLVLLTPGNPDAEDMPYGSSNWAEPTGLGAQGIQWMSKLRTRLGVKSYVIGFKYGTDRKRVDDFACAMAGSNNFTQPCNGTPYNNWDTCQDGVKTSSDRCAFGAESEAELEVALNNIISLVLEGEIVAGPTATVNEITPTDGDYDVTQTNISASTDMPSFQGHVRRCAPDDPPCVATADPLEPDAKELESFAYGAACGRSRTWDAGECLASRLASRRLIYSYDAQRVVYRIANVSSSGAVTASAKFVQELVASGAIASGDTTTANAIARYVHGVNAPEGWKLAGLAQSSPVVVRRIPAADPALVPGVSVRDPACAGRLLDGVSDVPPSLKDFSTTANERTISGGTRPDGGSYQTHRVYQEAVLVGSELGLMHAFHLDSGNEMFALLPRNLLEHVRDLAVDGQADDIADRKVGISTTLNQGYVFDDRPGQNRWRHLGVFGFGKGGTEYVVVDLQKLGDLAVSTYSTGGTSTGFPIEVLWSTDTIACQGPGNCFYDQTLGETWSRPVLTYQAPDDSFATEPRAFLVFGSGYRNAGVATVGRRLVVVDALTGETARESAEMSLPAANAMMDDISNYALVNDVAVASHCLSRYWGEMQETYLADVAGRVYRWDLGSGASGADFPLPHAADSGQAWSSNGGVAVPLTTFKACTGTSLYDCQIDPTRGDPFIYAPAVITPDRIDEVADLGQPVSPASQDQILIAMASGSPYDDSIDAGKKGNDYHASLYMIVDDHRNDPHGGLSSTALTGGFAAPGTDAKYMRLALTDIVRTREWTYPSGEVASETRPFSRRARPVGQPRIRVTGLVDGNGNVKPDVEVFYVTFVVYEPSENTCDPKWYDEIEREWVYDEGSSYEITFRMAANAAQGFDFTGGGGVLGGSNYGDGFGGGAGLQMRVEQYKPDTGACADGVCTPQFQPKANKPCAPTLAPPPPTANVSIPSSWAELDGFSPVEQPAGP